MESRKTQQTWFVVEIKFAKFKNSTDSVVVWSKTNLRGVAHKNWKLKLTEVENCHKFANKKIIQKKGD